MKRAKGGNVWTSKDSPSAALFDLQDRIVFIGSSLASILVIAFVIAGRAIPSKFFIQSSDEAGIWASKTLLYWIIAMGSGLTFCASSLMFIVLCRLGKYREFAPTTKIFFWVILPLTAVVCFVFMMSFSGN